MERLFGYFKRMLSGKKLWFAAIGAVVLISGGLWWIFRVQYRNIPPYSPNDIPADVAMRLNHVTFHGIANGKIVWELDAEHVDLTKDQQSYVVSGLKKMVLLKDGKQELIVNADGLQQNVATGDLNIFGHVSVMGKDLTLYTPGALWNDRMQSFIVPQKLSAQLGDITVVAEKGAQYSLGKTTLHSSGSITVSCGGNMVKANGVDLNGTTQQATITGPVHASFVLGDVEQWAAGQNLPKVPDIPQQIKDRYREYCRKKGYRY